MLDELPENNKTDDLTEIRQDAWQSIISGEVWMANSRATGIQANTAQDFRTDSLHHSESTSEANFKPMSPNFQEVERASFSSSHNDRLVQEGSRLYRAGRLTESFQAFYQAAQEGDPRAQLQVGFCYEEGLGVQKDYSHAAQWYEQAAKNGNSQAMKNLGQLLEYGAGVQEDWVSAAKWYKRAAESGNVDAMASLARAYQFGVGLPQNRQAALYWDKEAYARGHSASLEWIRKLSNPMNNIGFRNDDEYQLVMGDQLRTSGLLMGADPEGIAFANSAERISWLQKLRADIDQDERSKAQWQRQWQWQRNNDKSPFVPNPWQSGPGVDRNRELYRP